MLRNQISNQETNKCSLIFDLAEARPPGLRAAVLEWKMSVFAGQPFWSLFSFIFSFELNNSLSTIR